MINSDVPREPIPLQNERHVNCIEPTLLISVINLISLTLMFQWMTLDCGVRGAGCGVRGGGIATLYQF
ncbi:hypothetical protein D1AOALGA4SA_10796 [Olavius algarvensis Delta 1 endosymbiont]|nr:hypothetical protein D1AOALGA4SA_10796 [Olavius algarvensis Delta 1 endosymbiont]